MIAGSPRHRPTALTALAALAALAACGRINVDRSPKPDAAPDAVADAPPDACPLGIWSKPIVQPFANVNTADATEWGVEVSGDGLRVVFSTDRIDQDKQTTDYDIYMAQRASRSDPFDRPVRLTLSAGNEDDADPTLTADTRELYFVSTRAPGECLYVATRTDATGDWDNVRRLDALCPQDAIPSGPYISRDGLRLYYEADGENWMASRPSRGDAFTAPVAVGARGLTYCALADQELTIYCEHDEGRAQLWRATRPSTSARFPDGAAIPELASEAADGDPSITDDGVDMVYASTADSEGGRSDLYIAERACQ